MPSAVEGDPALERPARRLSIDGVPVVPVGDHVECAVLAPRESQGFVDRDIVGKRAEVKVPDLDGVSGARACVELAIPELEVEHARDVEGLAHPASADLVLPHGRLGRGADPDPIVNPGFESDALRVVHAGDAHDELAGIVFRRAPVYPDSAPVRSAPLVCDEQAAV